MKTLNAAIIGLGIGERHIEGYEKHPSCRVRAICDIDANKLAAVGSRHPGLARYESADELLAAPGIDVVSIASYDDRHYEQTMKAIRAGKHVFVEKPLCMREEEAADIRSALNERPEIRLSSNLILRRCPRFMLLKEKIAAGEFGELFHVESDYNFGRIQKITDDWRGDMDFYSVVYGGGVHIADLLQWLTGEDIVEAAAYGNRIATRDTRFKYNDMVVAALKFRNGMVGKLGANFACVFPHFHTLNLYGTNATFVNGLDAGLLYKSRDVRDAPERVEAAYPCAGKGDLIYSFVESILNGAEPEVSADDVFKSMSVCFAIEKAAATGQPVKVKFI